MQRIFSVGGSFLTSDRISHAVLDHASALAGAGRTEVLEVPALFGLVVRNARLLLSTALPLWSLPADGNDADLPAAAGAAIEQRTADLIAAPDPCTSAFEDFEFLDYLGFEDHEARSAFAV